MLKRGFTLMPTQIFADYPRQSALRSAEIRVRGVTLTEVLVTIALVVAVTMSFVLMDVSRFRVQQDLRTRATNQVGQSLLGLTSYHIARSLEGADRIVIRDSGITGVNPGGTANQGKIKFRYPTCPSPVTPACLDNPLNYTWGEYRLTGTRLEFLNNTCVAETLANGVSALTFRYKDRVPANPPPPGGEPFAPAPGTAQNNVVEYSLTWTGGGRTYTLRGNVASRAVAYTDANASLDVSAGDSGDGLAPAVAPPPAC